MLQNEENSRAAECRKIHDLVPKIIESNLWLEQRIVRLRFEKDFMEKVTSSYSKLINNYKPKRPKKLKSLCIAIVFCARLRRRKAGKFGELKNLP